MSRYLLNRIGSCRLFPVVQSTSPSILRLQSSSKREYSQENASISVRKPTPKARQETTVESFLNTIGRNASEKVKTTDWQEFWSLDGRALKAAGVDIRDRKYILWCMEKYRQGLDPKTFAYPPPPKKKIRGHGPAVQNGKRIRSRRKH